MHSITKELEWDMGHRVPNHKSKCRNPHGHRYKVQLTLTGDLIGEKGSSDEGMVMDFSDIKNISKGFIDEYLDHGFMFYYADEPMREMFEDSLAVEKFKYVKVEFIPTAENIAKFIYERLSTLFEDKYGTGLRLSFVRLWETPTSFADYSGAEPLEIGKLDGFHEEVRELIEEWKKGEGNRCLCLNKGCSSNN